MNRSIAAIGLLAFAAVSNAAILKYTAVLTGAQENPPVTTPASGEGYLEINTATNAYSGFIRWKGFTSTLSDAHIHVGVPGSNGSVIYGIGVAGTVADGAWTRKNFSGTLVDKNVGNHGGAGTSGLLTPTQQLASWFNVNKTYFNVHSTAASGGFPGGEIRGQIQAVPEPASMVALGLGAAAFLRRRRR